MAQDNASQHEVRTGYGSPLFYQSEDVYQSEDASIALGRRKTPTPSLSTEIAHLCQFQSSERDTFTGRPNILTLRATIGAIRSGLGDKYDYSDIRMILSHVRRSALYLKTADQNSPSLK
jgi:hypothetical protein